MTYVKLEPAATRLGNWMFQYAAAKCAAPEEGVTFVIGGDQDMEPVKKYACLWPEAQYVREAPAGAPVRVGLFQDSKYIDRALARRLFLDPLRRAVTTSRTTSRDETSILPLQLETPTHLLVSIHVRRGDYMALPHRHPFVGKKYLRDAIARFPNAQFLVFSDDIPWCKGFFKGEKFRFAEGNDVLTDLYLMTRCRGGHICSNSTFSWWGAYLGEGKTIFPSMWYGPAIKGEDWRGMYFDGSEVVENGYSMDRWLKARMCMVKNMCGNVLRKVGLR